MGEESYMSKPYCLECMGKHANRFEHHSEDLWTASTDDPKLRAEAEKILDAARKLRKKIDEIRVEQLALKKLKESGI